MNKSHYMQKFNEIINKNNTNKISLVEKNKILSSTIEKNNFILQKFPNTYMMGSILVSPDVNDKCNNVSFNNSGIGNISIRLSYELKYKDNNITIYSDPFNITLISYQFKKTTLFNYTKDTYILDYEKILKENKFNNFAITFADNAVKKFILENINNNSFILNDIPEKFKYLLTFS